MGLDTIIGIILAIVTTFIGIWYSKKLKDKISLSLLNENWVSLLNIFHEEYKSLKIEFTLPINTSVLYYSGTIFNSGSIDIDKSRIYAPLEIQFPKDCKIMDTRIIKLSSEKIIVDSKYVDNKVEFTWDLLKPSEYFTFETIIESSKNYTQRSFKKEIIINHRISDLKTINSLEIPSTTKNRKRFWINYIGIFFFMMAPLIAMASLAYYGIKTIYTPNIKTDFKIVLRETKTEVKLKEFNNKNVLMRYDGIVGTVAYKQINQIVELKPNIHSRGIEYPSLIVGSIFFIGILIFFVMLIKDFSNEYKVFKIISTFKD